MVKSLYIKENSDHALDWEYICSFDTAQEHCGQWLEEIEEFYKNDFWMISIVNNDDPSSIKIHKFNGKYG